MAITNPFPKSFTDIPEKYKAPLIDQKTYLVNGELRTHEGKMQNVLSPVCIKDGGVYVQMSIGGYPLMNSQQALEALDAAAQAYDNGRGKWATMSVQGRIEHVEEFLKRMVAAREPVVNTLMWEIAKTRKDSEKEFDRTVDYCKKTIETLKELDRTGSHPISEEGVLGQIRRSPLGVGVCMGPFNYPLNETFTTLIPAVIMGNTVVFKPAKYGVLLHEPLLKAYQESFPKGVINIVYGDGKEVIGPLMASGRPDFLAFIGSAKVASILEKQHPRPNRLECIEGLNAKNPSIILDDADLETAVCENVTGALSYNGQRCTAHKLIFVHRGIADQFISQFCDKVDKLKIGMPWEDGVQITPLPEDGKVKYLDGLVEDAISKGAKIANSRTGSCMTLYAPVVLTGVTPEMRVYQEEQFGPVVPIVVFDDINTPLDYIDNSEFGQQVALFGRDPRVIGNSVDVLANLVSRVNINSQCQRGPDSFPFGGRKDSAKKILSISDALKVLSTRTVVAAKQTPENNDLIRKIWKEGHSNFLSTDYII